MLSRDAQPLALYVHFPWCVRKCPYCDFNSHPLRGEVPETAYVDALIRDLDFELRSFDTALAGRGLGSIFMGGGTPSLFSDAAIARLLDAVAARLPMAPDIEITLEANPGTVDESHFRGYRAAGVNRLSIGVQSMDDAQLRALGRIHGREDAIRAVDIAHRAGFDNLNLDLMFALPRQTPEAAETDLRALIALAPEHVSYYHLTLEPNTAFAAAPPPLPDDDAAWAIHTAGQALLADAGYAQYEVSAYARPNRRARHNLSYWTFGDYLGIGAGAHGKIGTGVSGIRRRARHKLPRLFLAGAGSAAALQSDSAVETADLPFEFMMNVLRLHEGFVPQAFVDATGLALDAIEIPLVRAQTLGLIERTPQRIRPSARGRDHLNSLIELFLPDA